MPIKPILPSEQPKHIHSLEGLPEEPPSIEESVIKRLFFQLAKCSAYSDNMRRVFTGNHQMNVQKTKTLATDIKNNNYKQAGSHLGTAVLAVWAGVAAGKAGVDAASAISITTKLGDGAGSILRGSESWLSSEKQMEDQKITKGADAGRRVNDFYQQFRQAVQSVLDQRAQQVRPMGG